MGHLADRLNLPCIKVGEVMVFKHVPRRRAPPLDKVPPKSGLRHKFWTWEMSETPRATIGCMMVPVLPGLESVTCIKSQASLFAYHLWVVCENMSS
jgi:hypothetical protein